MVLRRIVLRLWLYNVVWWSVVGELTGWYGGCVAGVNRVFRYYQPGRVLEKL